MSIQSNYTQGQTFNKDGKEYTVVSNSFKSDYIVVLDEYGNTFRQRKFEALFRFRDERYKKNLELIEKYREQGKKFSLERDHWKNIVSDFLNQMGLCQKNSDEYNKLKDKYWEARFKTVEAGNCSLSASLNAFIVASSTSNWS